LSKYGGGGGGIGGGGVGGVGGGPKTDKYAVLKQKLEIRLSNVINS
jgi:hypothetical protein